MNSVSYLPTDEYGYGELNQQDKPLLPESAWPAPLDLLEMAQHEPTAPDFIIEDWMPAGYATLLAGHGGAGKSSIALHQAVCIALGMPWCGFTTKQREILYLSCEDGKEVIHWRLYRICQHMNISIAELHGKLRILDLVGTDVVLYQPSGQTAPFQELTKALPGSDVIYVDGISDVYSGDENNRAMVKQFINLLLSIIPKTGAVVLIGHVNKLAAGSNGTSQGYSGSTGWHNSVRARWYLHQEAKEDDEVQSGALILDLQKSNLGTSDQKIRFKYDDTYNLFVGEFVAGFNSYEGKVQEQRIQGAILDIIAKIEADRINDPDAYVPASVTGPHNAWSTISSHPDWPSEFQGKAYKRRFDFWVRRMKHSKQIGTETIKGKNRNYVTICTVA